MFPAQNHPLWIRLQSFDFDGVCDLPFSARLARENGWSRAFSERVCEEYRRFLFLACESGHAVTPSEEVDQAWHLHLIYSRSYWEDLCPNVLQKPLHHGPTKGGRVEGLKFENWYARTLESYEKWFGHAPPRDIWPESKQRFGEAAHFRRVNTRRFWLVPKVSLAQGLSFIAALLLGGCGMVWSQPNTPNPLDWGGGPFLALFWILCVTLLPFSLYLRSAELKPRDRAFPSETEPYEVARLQEKGHFTLEVALTRMLQIGAISIDNRGLIRRQECFSGQLFAFERAVWNALSFGKNFSTLSMATIPALEKLDARLREQGLLATTNSVWAAQKIPFSATAFLLLFGCAKVVLGLARERPVGFLLISLLFVAIFGISLLFRVPRHSGRGQAWLQHLRREQWNLPSSEMNWVVLALVFGGATLIAPEIRAYSRPTSSGDSGSGCGSGGGCGGGGCGGGGCGGCGGG